LTDDHVSKNKFESEDFIDQLKRKHKESTDFLESRIKDLERDCELKDT